MAATARARERRWRRVVLVTLCSVLLLVGCGVVLADRLAAEQPARTTTTARTAFPGNALYAAPSSAGTAAASPSLSLAQRRVARTLAAVPQAVWLNGGSASASASLARSVSAAAARAHRTASFVVYDIPDRDCGGDSSGGAPSAAAYRTYIAAVARQLGATPTVVVLEPDAIPGLDCLTASGRSARYQLLREAIRALAARPHVLVYLDAGNRGWQLAQIIAARLTAAGVSRARGFALNVSNYDPTGSEIAYGHQIAAGLRDTGTPFIVDVSRNGARTRPAGWCNPGGTHIGAAPNVRPHLAGVDALLWIKHPGESDGQCGRSHDPAGQYDPALAAALTR